MTLKDLDKYILEDIRGYDHPSDFIKRDEYSVLILRLPKVNSTIKIESFAFIIEDNIVYSYNRETQEIEKLGSLASLIDTINQKVDKLISDIKKYHILIDNLEEDIYNRNLNDKFMQEWLSYKKDVSLINRLMFHSYITIEQFANRYKRELNSDLNIHALEDIKEETKRVYDLSKSALDKLENLYNFYRAKVDERMNKNVYYLTLLSGIFLPLTLLTGFFGMNTGGLPLQHDTLGTWKVVLISIILEIVFFLPFILQNLKKIKRFK
ncbi:MAG: magnesium transporter [Epsilonproteobacteria bacterium]|nr:magnesium transporter [Campylobacterota bacterium]